MAATAGTITARLMVSIGDVNAYEVGTFDLPVGMELQGSALGVKNIDIRRPLAHALQDAGKQLLKELNTKPTNG